MIDITFDVYSDTPPGGDPDQMSATLRRYHALLWSKPLPNGLPFMLSTETRGAYPENLGAYRGYRKAVTAFIAARNARIVAASRDL